MMQLRLTTAEELLTVYRFITFPSPAFATQMWYPSKAIANGNLPAESVPRLAPSIALSFVMLFPL